MSRWAGLGLALLPLQAPWFAALAALVGFWRLLLGRKPYLGGAFLGLALLGALGQGLSFQGFVFALSPPDYVTTTKGGPPNPISPLLHGFLGWNHEDLGQRIAQRVAQGFWRIPRHNPKTGREFREFLEDRWYPLEPGQTYTQSFYLRHDGSQARLTITFFTQRGHHPVPTQMKLVAPGVWRVWARYTAQEGDGAVRAIDILNEGGDFTYLEVGWPQLEQGPTPSPYRMGPTGLRELGWRLQWWVGAALMGFLVLQGGVWLFQRTPTPAPTAALAVLVGMLAHLGYAGWQWLEAGTGARVAGLTPQPNFLGHGAVAAAGLVWVLGGRRLGGVALAVATLTLWLSGSRTAFWALLLLGLGWGWSLGRYRWAALGMGGLLAGVALAEPGLLGRLAQVAFDHSAQARLQFWQVAWQAFREHPLGGVGFGHFPLYFDLHPPSGAIEYSPGHAHNLGLHLLAEGGLLSLLGLGLWLAGVARALVARRAWPALVLLGAILLLNTTDFTFFSAWVYYPLILATASALAQRPH